MAHEGFGKNIHDLVLDGNFELIKNWIYFDINLIDAISEIDGKTPLIICAHKKSHYEIARFLLDCGCDVNIQSNFKWNNWTALMTACYYGNTPMVEALIKANANLDILDVSGCTALQLALENENVECIQIVLNEKEMNTIEHRLKLEKSLQDAVLIHNDHELAMDSLLKINKENVKQVINSTTSGSHTLLYKACRNGNPDIVRLLLSNGAVARPHYYTKYSPLYIACHMGNYQISKLILEKFPHLIQVPTIENFLPFHAVCSQGHLDILQLLLSFNPTKNSSDLDNLDEDFHQIYTDHLDRRYLSSFDLNALDMNGQSGFHLAVLGNHQAICKYLVYDYQVKQLDKSELDAYELKRTRKLESLLSATNKRGKKAESARTVGSSEQDETVAPQISLFDHFRNVFLDPKSYDPYVVNYVSNPHEAGSDSDQDYLTLGSYLYNTIVASPSAPDVLEPSTDDSRAKEEQIQRELERREAESEEATSARQAELEDQKILINPINVNSYSKFGTTCLHEAIKHGKLEIIKFLLEIGANPDLPIYDMNSNQSLMTTTATNGSSEEPTSVLSNCLCEAIRLKDELIFLQILANFTYSDSGFSLAYSLCTDLWRNEETRRMEHDPLVDLLVGNISYKRMMGFLLRLKIVPDLECKVSTFKSLVMGSIYAASASNVSGESGLILNWNSFEPKLGFVFESWLLESCRHFRKGLKSSKSFSANKGLKERQHFASSYNVEQQLHNDDYQGDRNTPATQFEQQLKKSAISSKRLHLVMITRIDLSGNKLDSLPLAIFQIESLKFLKLSHNQLSELPSRHNRFDDTNKKSRTTNKDAALTWSCHSLLEIDVDNNLLKACLSPQLFQLKSLKHLNASNNQLSRLPEEMWTAPSIVELNVSFNCISSLPIASRGQSCSAVTAHSDAPSPSLKKIQAQKSRAKKSDPTLMLTGEPAAFSSLPIGPEKIDEKMVIEALPLLSATVEQNHRVHRQIQMSYEEKMAEKANFWHRYSILNAELASSNFEELFADQGSKEANSKELTRHQQSAELKYRGLAPAGGDKQPQSALKELNLSHNRFVKIPECLSCLTPQLIKLNLSHNRLVAMGAICDLPKSLKFLDLSNNAIKFSMRLLNERLLNLIHSYFENYSDTDGGSPSDQDYRSLLDKLSIQSKALLDSDLCYKGLIEGLSRERAGSALVATRDAAASSTLPNTTDNVIARVNRMNIFHSERSGRNVGNVGNGDSNNSDSRFRKRSPLQRETNAAPQASNNKTTITSKISSNINSFSANRRRARSQSKSHLSSHHRNAINLSYKLQAQGSHKACQVPFDIFLLNLKNMNSMAAAAATEMANDDLSSPEFREPESDEPTDNVALEQREKRLLASHVNIQLFMDHVCPHKRHVKLENLKSINLSHNRLKRTKLMFELEATGQATSETSNHSTTNVLSSLLLAGSNQATPKIKSQAGFGLLAGQETEAVSNRVNHSQSSESDMSLSEEALSDHETGDKSGSWKAANKLKLKGHLFSDKKPVVAKTHKERRAAGVFINNREEKAKMVAKLMFPNLTHLDVSHNQLRHLSYKLVYVENLSYLNASANKSLTRVSPRLGLLTKLWNFDLKQCESLNWPSNLDSMVRQHAKTASVLSYLKSIMEQSKPYARVKLMFVGIQAIGKTSLLGRLREEGTVPANYANRQTWSERNQKQSNSSKQNISTVGIDINEWVYDKSKHKPLLSSNQTILHLQQQAIYLYQIDYLLNKTLGPVTFKTWDFGGQKEYYSTHQYFLSKRALYLVCWKLTEEEKGLVEIQNWLTNIQTRAPGSPVIIVGTHQDQLVKHRNYREISSFLQRMIYERFVKPTGENETASPYPPIMASLEVSSRTGFNIKLLAKIIYETASQMKAPGLKDQSLLEQKIPHTYLALEECCGYIARKLKLKSQNPVLSTANYLKEIRQACEEIYPTTGATSSGAGGQDNQLEGNRSILMRFRDDAEILQATQFLHENGILMHYNDTGLRDLFFLEPQWLCDVLASVITVREINPFAARGIMKIADLQVLFKGSRFNETDEIMRFIVDLLGKFELALTWDNEHLIIPSLLPSEALLPFANGSKSSQIRVDMLGKERALSKLFDQFSEENPHIISDFYQKKYSTPTLFPVSASCLALTSTNHSHSHQPTTTSNETAKQQQKQQQQMICNSHSQILLDKPSPKSAPLFECEAAFSPATGSRPTAQRYRDSVVRLYSLRYIPSGLFSRLIARILSDNMVKSCLPQIVDLDYSQVNKAELLANTEQEKDTSTLRLLVDFVCQKAEWRCWQTGIELNYLGCTLMSIKQLIADPFASPQLVAADQTSQTLGSSLEGDVYTTNPVMYRDCENEIQLKVTNNKWAFVECFCSFKNFNVKWRGPEKQQQQATETENETTPSGDEETLLKIRCNRKAIIKLFALVIEIIDSLLEDWFPDLGTKFMQDSKGQYLVTRLSPCLQCLDSAERALRTDKRPLCQQLNTSAQESNYELILRELLEFNQSWVRDNVSEASGLSNISISKSAFPETFRNTSFIYCFMIDDLCYSVLKSSILLCPQHGEQQAETLAPDLAFDDIEDNLLVSKDILKIESLLGRGSFGLVFSGVLSGAGKNLPAKRHLTNHIQSGSLSFENFNKVRVAVKILETMNTRNAEFVDNDTELEAAGCNFRQCSSLDIGQTSPHTKNSKLVDHWNHRKSIQLAAKAYTVARQEIAILGNLSHENIVSMLGLSVKPLAIILELAPLGNLKDILEEYKKSACKLNAFVVQQVCVQVSSALVYLHAKRIIYRDLKCDNVLAWTFPKPQESLARKHSLAHLSNLQLNSAGHHSHQQQQPNRSLNISSVRIKLADYSISRSVLPTGTKGFAGTEGFMAPEIVRFNGEETYTEKVDCFSFGMVLYELVSLKLPFEGSDQIKDIILNDVRPLIKSQESLYPTLMLDLMCLCWLDDPCERPTAQAIYNFSKSYEFSHLSDVTILEDYEEAPLVVCCKNKEQETIEDIEVQAIQKIRSDKLVDVNVDRNAEDPLFLEDEEFEEEQVLDLWVVRNSQNEGSSQIEILSYEYSLNCTGKKVINVCPGKIEMLCVYNENQVWCVDSSKCLYIYCAISKRKLNQYLLDVKLTASVVSMFALEAVRRILICTSNGSILLINAELAHQISLKKNSPQSEKLFDSELEYILIDIPIRICTTMLLQSRYDKNFDLWIGSENTEIFCFSLKSMKLTGSYLHSSSHHFVTNSVVNSHAAHSAKINIAPINKGDVLSVTVLKNNPNDTFFLWSYVYPGTTIFLWNHVSKKIMSAYNCLRAFEDLNFKPIGPIRTFRVVDISFMNGHLYCGINNGLVIVLKRLTLTPLFMFTSHMHQLNTICALTFETHMVSYNPYNDQEKAEDKQSDNNGAISKNLKKTSHTLVSFGRALAPVHEDIYLSSTSYRDRVKGLKNYANCLIVNSWNCNEGSVSL